MATLRKANIPELPGVYAVYRDGERMYVGKANCLRNRVWKDHWGLGKCLTGSALRRNVAKHLDIASSADIKAGLAPSRFFRRTGQRWGSEIGVGATPFFAVG